MFTLTIETGNAAMQTPLDVAETLKWIAEALCAGRLSGSVFDLNGNTVGRYELTSD